MSNNKLAVFFAACLGLSPAAVHGQTYVVFSNSFDGVLPEEITTNVATLTGVQGYAGLGPNGNKFGGSFLRSPTGNAVTLTLSNLPPHTELNIAMLFAAIDSLDGTGNYPSGDFFRVTVGSSPTNGIQVFRESFANADPGQFQSYVPPPGGELARRVDLGFSGPGGYYTDSAYNFGVDSRFNNLAHTGSVAVITFLMEGPGVQSLEDESWSIDNLSVSASSGPAPVITQMLIASNQVYLAWTAMTNRDYIVQTCANIGSPSWTDLLPAVTATNIRANFATSIEGGNRFYRVKQLPP